MKMKRCTECGDLYPERAFYKGACYKDGYRNECINCKSADYYLRNNSGILGDSLLKKYKTCMASHSYKNKTKGVNTLSFLQYSRLMLSSNCPACGRQFSDDLIRVIDRVDNEKPLSNANCWCICGECNLSKSNKDGLYLLKLAYAVLEKEGKLREVDVDY